MNSTVQLKNSLIARIESSDDLNFLKALQTIFDSSEQELYQLNGAQEASIESGRKEIEAGEFLNNEEVISELKEWLKNE